MKRNVLGDTGLEIGVLGAGLSELGHRLTLQDVEQAAAVLNIALDNGVNFLDTAACYKVSEELVGMTVSHRRSEFIIATKAGHVTAGYQGEEWTARTILDSIDRSLARMKTDYLDLVQLHSPRVEILERGEAIEALQEARRAGKTRFIGFSGDNQAALRAVDGGWFDTLQTSYNIVDQRAAEQLLPLAREKGMGIIIKRPIANAAFGVSESPSLYADEYFERAVTMSRLDGIPELPGDPIHAALGFALENPYADTIIVGTHQPSHMSSNLEYVLGGKPLARKAMKALKDRFDTVGRDWPQLQ